MTGTQNPDPSQAGQAGQGSSPNWRQLEQSRDNYKSQAEKWQKVALQRTAQQLGFDPNTGVGKLLLDNFQRDHQDSLDPDSLDDTFTSYVQELGIEAGGQGQGEGQGQGNPQGEAPQGNTQPTSAEQLIESRQGQGQQLQGMAQPQQGEKSLQQQITDAQQAGDQDIAQQLSFQLATQQFVESAQKGG